MHGYWQTIERRLAVAALVLACSVALPGPTFRNALAQAPAAAAADDEDEFSADELQDLVAPIALYPDPLVAIILPASTFPLDIVQAHRFIDTRARNPNAQPDSSWHESVRALLNYPEVVKQLNDDLDWTNDLGVAVANQQSDVMDAIQRYRRTAMSAGNLRTDQRQQVTQAAETVVIQPTNPEQVYVPQYDPDVVVVQQQAGAPPPMGYYPEPYPNYAYPYPSGFPFTGFATGMVVGGLTAAWAMDWDNGGINNNVNVNRNVSGNTVQVGGGQRWNAERTRAGGAAGDRQQLRQPRREGGGAARTRPSGGDRRDLGARTRPGDPQFARGERDRAGGQGRDRQQSGAGGQGRDRAQVAAGGQGRQRPQASHAQARPNRDAFANQGSRQSAQRHAERGQASRASARPAPAAHGGGGARQAGGGGGGGARGHGGGGGGGGGGGRGGRGR